MNFKCNNPRYSKNSYFFKYKTAQLTYNQTHIYKKKNITSIKEGTYRNWGAEQSGDSWLCEEQFFFRSPSVRLSYRQNSSALCNKTQPVIQEAAERLQLKRHRRILRPLSAVSLNVRLFLSCLHNNKSVRERILPNAACAWHYSATLALTCKWTRNCSDPTNSEDQVP